MFFFRRLESVEAASVFVVLLLPGRESALLAAEATLEMVRTEFFVAMFFTSFRAKTRQAEKAGSEDNATGIGDGRIIAQSV